MGYATLPRHNHPSLITTLLLAWLFVPLLLWPHHCQLVVNGSSSSSSWFGTSTGRTGGGRSQRRGKTPVTQMMLRMNGGRVGETGGDSDQPDIKDHHHLSNVVNDDDDDHTASADASLLLLRQQELPRRRPVAALLSKPLQSLLTVFQATWAKQLDHHKDGGDGSTRPPPPPRVIAIVTMEGLEKGEHDDHHHRPDSTVVVTGGLLVLSSSSASSSSSRSVFFPGRWRRRRYCRSLPLLHALALVADGIIVILPANSSDRVVETTTWCEGLVHGLHHRAQIITGGGEKNGQRGRLLVWRATTKRDDDEEQSSDDDDDELLRASLSLELFPDLSPDAVERYDLVSNRSHLQQTVAEWTRELLQSPDDNSHDHLFAATTEPLLLLPWIQQQPSLVPLILQAAYDRLGGRSEESLLGGPVPLDGIFVVNGSRDDNDNKKTNSLVVVEIPATVSSNNEELVPRGGGGGGATPPPPQVHLAKSADADDATAVVATTVVDILHGQMDALQDLLDANEQDDSSMPIDFGQHVSVIIDQLLLLQQQPGVVDAAAATSALGERLAGLHQQHVHRLRDYFGRLYETILDQNSSRSSSKKKEDGTTTTTVPSRRVIRRLQERTIRSFGRAAAESVPNHAVPFDMDHVQRALAGLSQDLQDMTDLRRDMTGEALLADDDDDDEDNEGGDEAASTSRGRWWRRRLWKNLHQPPPRWVKALVARAIMLAVNYAQGWLALQGIQNAALERERNLPKIPLF